MGHLSIVGTWTLLPFPGALFKTYKRGIFGYRIALLTFDNNYLLGNIHWYSIAVYVNMRTCETRFLILLVEYYTAISPTEIAVPFRATCISHAKCVSH